LLGQKSVPPCRVLCPTLLTKRLPPPSPAPQAAARIVLQDWNGGNIPFYTLPPSRGNEAFDSAEVVAGWAAEFDADQVFAAEQKAIIDHLPSLAAPGTDASGAARQFFAAASAGRAEFTLPTDMDATDNRRTNGAAADGDDESSEEDEMDADDGAAELAARRKAAAGAPAAAAVLYGEDGQFNPHKARADKKAKKKSKALGEAMEAADDDSDFDFDEANGAGGSEAEGGSEEYGEGGAKDADAAYADDMEGSDLE
jgi:nuclear GTP-binding protein